MQQLYANYSLLMIMLGAGIITLLLQSIAGHVMNDLLEECSKIAGTKNPWIRNLIKNFKCVTNYIFRQKMWAVLWTGTC